MNLFELLFLALLVFGGVPRGLVVPFRQFLFELVGPRDGALQVDDLRGATDNLDAVRNATFLVAAVQAVAAIFLIANMVQIAAFSRRDEISIMRMVGASRWYTQAPFVLEAVLATIIGALLATAGLFLGKEFVIDKALRGLYDSQLIAPVTTADIWLVVPVVALIGIVFAGLTAQVALRSYVRK